MQEFETKVREYKRGLIKELLSQCTEPQKAFFDRLHESIETIKEDRMKDAYYQCLRTIKNNKRS